MFLRVVRKRKLSLIIRLNTLMKQNAPKGLAHSVFSITEKRFIVIIVVVVTMIITL